MISKKLILLGVFILFNSCEVFAEDDFSVDIKSNYDVDKSGLTTVSNQITITNLKDNEVASNYHLKLLQLDIFDLKAFDTHGKLDVNEKSTQDEINLEIFMKNLTIGKGKTNTFTVQYKTKYVAYKVGNIWNVQIPSSQSDHTTQSLIKLIIPAEFGPRIYISPLPDSISETQTTSTYIFDGATVGERNIAASFGKFQILNFRLKYQLENPNRFSSFYTIALPPTIRASQLVVYRDIEPKPHRTFVDQDGNYMAVFKVKAKSFTEVKLSGSAQLNSRQIDISRSKSLNDLPKKLTKAYTAPSSFWQTQSAVVSSTADKLKQNDFTVAQNAHSIYRYLVEQYDYDFEIAKKDFVDRLGAEKALQNKDQWGCMEFTDSFVALARTTGIPSREINGYAITNNDAQHPISVELKNGDLLHSWPEFYDPFYGWVQIDPTWGDTSNSDYFTKMDTNHFALVIKGMNPDYPLPAGTYRVSDKDKLVEVAFAQDVNNSDFESKFTAKKSLSFNVLKILHGYRSAYVKNTGKTFLFDENENPIAPGLAIQIFVKRDQSNVDLHDSFGNVYTAKL
jgi:transglutaminase-like putative cysteine protease